MSIVNFEVPYLKFSKEFEITNNGKSTVIYGSNGMGKTSIYNSIKEKNLDYAYIDYSDMKSGFINGKNKEINITPHAQQYNDLVVEKENNSMKLDIVDSLKRFDINGSASKAKEVSPNLVDAQKTKKISSKLTISQNNHAIISKLIDEDIKFLLKNFKQLSEIIDIDEDIKVLKEEYLKDVLKHLDDNLKDDCTICPVCDSEVSDLMTIIKRKILSIKQIKSELLNEFKLKNSGTKNDELLHRFDNLIELSKTIDEKDVLDYLLVPNFEKCKGINQALEVNQKLEKMMTVAKTKMVESYTNLKNIQNEYTSYISNKFAVKVVFSDVDNSIKIKLERHPKQYSTGEFNLILFATKVFEYVGSDKKIMVLDDPISSYDIINQYKIAFDIVSCNKDNEKNFLIFTHNMSLINLINTQQRGLFEFKMIDKSNGIISLYSLKDFAPDSIMSVNRFLENANDDLNLKFVKLAIERDNKNVDKSVQDKIHKLFHYDHYYEFDLKNHDLYDYRLSNDNLVKIVDEVEYDNFDNSNYTELVVYKIIVMLALRVWIEKKLFDVLSTDSEYLKKQSLTEKISYALPKSAVSRVAKVYPKLERTDLMSRKVMLNQHEHYMSQGEPFYYVLNLSIDDIYSEIAEIKNLFETK